MDKSRGVVFGFCALYNDSNLGPRDEFTSVLHMTGHGVFINNVLATCFQKMLWF